MTKILYSPGFGAGWSTWERGESPEFTKFMLTYPPLIAAVEAGEILVPNEATYQETEKVALLHPALQQFLLDAKEKFGMKPYIGGARDLAIYEVSGPFRIEEYDGSESVIETYDDWITL